MDILVRHLDSAFGPEECRGGSVGGVVRVTDIAPDFLTLSLLSFDMVRQSIARTSIAACTTSERHPSVSSRVVVDRVVSRPPAAVRIWEYSAPLFVVSQCRSLAARVLQRRVYVCHFSPLGMETPDMQHIFGLVLICEVCGCGDCNKNATFFPQPRPYRFC